MITELLLSPIFALISFLINLIPTFDSQGFVLGSIEVITDIWSKISFFIPINLILASIAFLLLIDSWNSVLFVINWLIKKIPFI